MRFQFFIFCFFFLFSENSFSLNDKNLRDFAHLDEWGSPQNRFDKYHLIPLKEEIRFYDNISLAGSPKFTVTQSGFLLIGSSVLCEYLNPVKEKLLKQWLTCYPLKCNEISKKVAEKVLVTSSLEKSWFLESENRLKSPCPMIPEIGIKRNGLKETLDLILNANSKDSSVSVGGKKYFPALPFCKGSNHGCYFNVSRADDPESVEKRMRIQGPKPKYFEDFEKCFTAANPKKCLKQNTMTIQELDEFGLFYRVNISHSRTISWDKENIKELRACLSQNQLLDGRMSYVYYKGILKKCLFFDLKVVAIEYPEAFFYTSPINEKGANFEKP